ncbi:MAG: hypothetical protein E7547_03945, partial [Ruminococcaceae bacterium]|nr:hypothetical protein [Oscillospiraceae bacterium]
MKGFFSKIKISKIRAKLFATVFAALVVLFALIMIFSSPMLFKTFAFQTYRDLSDIADSINAC